MQILTINAGSSSIRLASFAVEDGRLRLVHRKHHEDHSFEPIEALQAFLASMPPGLPAIGAVAHRIVHGGALFDKPTFLDAEAEAALDGLSPLAPLHNPPALRYLRAARMVVPSNLPHIGVFDTSFFVHLPPEAATLPLPRELCQEHRLRRYGFHGIAHQAMSQTFASLRPDLPQGGKVITLQLGSGASAAAIEHGRPVDTSMGFSPLQGLIMATRTGDLDPGVVSHLQTLGWQGRSLEDLLYRRSGLLGISGISNDMKKLLASSEASAALALRMYASRVRSYIGAYLVALQGADAIVFGGGVGENSPAIRERIVAPLRWLGVILDPDANQQTIGKSGMIHAPESRIALAVIPTEEAPLLAQAALPWLSLTPGTPPSLSS